MIPPPQPAGTPNRYIDLSLTFRENPVTGDVTTLVDDASIKASVQKLILTNNYETPFHPEIGCTVMQSLFENFTPMTAQRISSSITEVLTNWEPRIIVLGVSVQVSPDLNGYTAILVYRIVNTPLPVTVSIFLERLR